MKKIIFISLALVAAFSSCSHRTSCPSWGSDYHWKKVSVVKNPFGKKEHRKKRVKNDGNYFTLNKKQKNVKYRDAFSKKQKKQIVKKGAKDAFGKKWRKQYRKYGKKAIKGKKPKKLKQKEKRHWKNRKEKNREKDPFDGKPKKKMQKKKKKKERGLWPKNSPIQK